MSIGGYEVQSHDQVAFITAVAAMVSMLLWDAGVIPFWVFMVVPSLTMLLAIRRYKNGIFDATGDSE